MTRTDSPEPVRLSKDNWLALASLVLTLVLTAWAFTLQISGQISALQVEVRYLAAQIDALDPRLPEPRTTARIAP